MKFNKTTLNNCVKILEYYKCPECFGAKFEREHNKILIHIQEELKNKIERLKKGKMKDITLWE